MVSLPLILTLGLGVFARALPSTLGQARVAIQSDPYPLVIWHGLGKFCLCCHPTGYL